ncbi:hypothetical protein H696_05127 [Fonticula alba]|uniref:RING-type domain-containing protein n=1 Tax=Fonticula alba TaxID=691883 RepID=A0A058Z2N2_FONAL|nr:hypothetical protein H696_05127 [Fonticula alba]KCV68198.1 hypothetical protein H696_05127 [Fonticula alba]|eukprot:XP_009497252.1 hypothetical protein H696_05127 [Fonticula alba]
MSTAKHEEGAPVPFRASRLAAFAIRPGSVTNTPSPRIGTPPIHAHAPPVPGGNSLADRPASGDATRDFGRMDYQAPGHPHERAPRRLSFLGRSQAMPLQSSGAWSDTGSSSQESLHDVQSSQHQQQLQQAPPPAYDLAGSMAVQMIPAAGGPGPDSAAYSAARWNATSPPYPEDVSGGGPGNGHATGDPSLDMARQQSSSSTPTSARPGQRHRRATVARNVHRLLAAHRSFARFMQWCKMAVSFVEILVDTAALTIGPSTGQCAPLFKFLIAHLAMSAGFAALSIVTLALMTGSPAEERRPVKYARRTLRVMGTAWFAGAHWYMFRRGGYTLHRAPVMHWTTVAWIVKGYISLAMPLIIQLVLLTCLPCVMGAWSAAATGAAAAASARAAAGQQGDGGRRGGSSASNAPKVDKGADEARIKNLPALVFQPGGDLADDDALCAICLGDYEPGETFRRLPCKHHFHMRCIDQWLPVNKHCPLCMQSIDSVPSAGDASPLGGRADGGVGIILGLSGLGGALFLGTGTSRASSRGSLDASSPGSSPGGGALSTGTEGPYRLQQQQQQQQQQHVLPTVGPGSNGSGSGSEACVSVAGSSGPRAGHRQLTPDLSAYRLHVACGRCGDQYPASSRRLATDVPGLCGRCQSANSGTPGAGSGAGGGSVPAGVLAAHPAAGGAGTPGDGATGGALAHQHLATGGGAVAASDGSLILLPGSAAGTTGLGEERPGSGAGVGGATATLGGGGGGGGGRGTGPAADQADLPDRYSLVAVAGDREGRHPTPGGTLKVRSP